MAIGEPHQPCLQPPLTPEEEARLWRQVEKGGKLGELARQALIQRSMGLVHSIVRQRTPPQSHDYDDLILAGTIGLIKAVDRFDPSRGTRLSTYATRWIIGAVQRAREEMLRHKTVSLDEPVTDGMTTTRLETLADPQAIIPGQTLPIDLDPILQFLQELKPQHQALFWLYLEDHSYDTLASLLGITLSQVKGRIHRLLDSLDAAGFYSDALRRNSPAASHTEKKP